MIILLKVLQFTALFLTLVGLATIFAFCFFKEVIEGEKIRRATLKHDIKRFINRLKAQGE